MTIQILDGDIHVIDLQTRIPFRYGIATMTSAPHVFVRLHIDVDGRESTGIAADLLPPRWFTKVPEKPIDVEVDEMIIVVQHAVTAFSGLEGDSVYALWRQLTDRQSAWAGKTGHPTLLNQFGTSLVERALIEAFCRLRRLSFHEAVLGNSLGIVLSDFDSRLTDTAPADWLPAKPQNQIIVRHTIGMADPLTLDELNAADRLHDGLPQSLDECIHEYGLQHFKIKVCGHLETDFKRLSRIAAVVTANAPSDFAFTLDGNEHFRTLEKFRTYWERLAAKGTLTEFFTHLMFVEQPFHRDVGLDESVLGDLRNWTDRPRLIIDESDAESGSLQQAISLGYDGTSHKNCKGIIKSIANACLIALLNRESQSDRFVLSAEDLANIGPVALLQDLAVAASLGIRSVERNGHHYFKGLSAFPASVCDQVLQHHGDLYTALTWPTLCIRNGLLELATVNQAPFGVGFEIDVEQFTALEDWRSD